MSEFRAENVGIGDDCSPLLPFIFIGYVDDLERSPSYLVPFPITRRQSFFQGYWVGGLTTVADVV